MAQHFAQGIHQGRLAGTHGPANAHGKGALQVVPLQGFLPRLERAGRLERFVSVAMLTVPVGMAVRVSLPSMSMVVMMVVVVAVLVAVLVLVLVVCVRGRELMGKKIGGKLEVYLPTHPNPQDKTYGGGGARVRPPPSPSPWGECA